MLSHGQKSHVAAHFNYNYPEIKNAVLSMMTLLASCGTNTGGSGVSDKKVMLQLILIDTDLRNTVVPLIIQLASYDTDANNSGIT